MSSSDTIPHALVVDDDALILMDASEILKDAGFRPLEAMNVAEAIDQLESHHDEITVLFTDVQMPGGRDGFDLARETAERWPDVKIVVASGNLKPEPNELPAGAVFIEKPFSADIIHQRLLELLPDGEKPEPLKQKAQK